MVNAVGGTPAPNVVFTSAPPAGSTPAPVFAPTAMPTVAVVSTPSPTAVGECRKKRRNRTGYTRQTETPARNTGGQGERRRGGGMVDYLGGMIFLLLCCWLLSSSSPYKINFLVFLHEQRVRWDLKRRFVVSRCGAVSLQNGTPGKMPQCGCRKTRSHARRIERQLQGYVRSLLAFASSARNPELAAPGSKTVYVSAAS